MPSRNDGCVTDGKLEEMLPAIILSQLNHINWPQGIFSFCCPAASSLHPPHHPQCTSISMAFTWKKCPLSRRGCVLTHRARPLRDAFPASGTGDSSEEQSHWGNPCKSTSYLLTHCQPIIIFYKCLLFVKNIKIEFHMQGKDTAMILEWHLTFLQ